MYSGEKGKTDPLLELKTAISAFNDHKTTYGHIKQTSQCAFPARYEYLMVKGFFFGGAGPRRVNPPCARAAASSWGFLWKALQEFM